MKRVLFLLTITILFVTAGCFDNQKTGSKPTGLDKLKAFVEKKATTVVTNGVYVTGVTAGAVTVLYTFPDFMDLSQDKQNTIFTNPKAFIVYKDKYINMPTFYADETVTAASFLNGTNGVKVIIDDKIIPQTVTNLLGVTIKSGTAALVSVPSILQSLESGISDFNTSTFVVRAVFNKPVTLNIGDITITGGKSEATVASITAGAIANSYDITIGSVKDFSAEYTITVKSVEKQEATKVFPYTALKLDVLPALNSNMMTVSQWVTMYNTTSNAIYFQNLSTRILANSELKEESSRQKILCLEANGISSYYLSSWIEDSKGNRLTNNIEVIFQSIYGSLAKTSDTFTVVDGYATNKLLSMQNTDVVLDRIKVRVTKTPEDATGYLGRESDFLQVAYMPKDWTTTPFISGITKLSIDLKIVRVENSNIADRVVIDFDKSLSASASTLGVNLFDYLNKKNFKDTLIIRDNIRNRNYKIVQWYKL